MKGPMSFNLILSLAFGVGQIAVGAWLAWHTLRGARDKRWRTALLTFAGLWFVVSGVIELFVSGMETSQRLTGAPAADVFTLWRGRADTTLFVASALLAVGALAYALIPTLALRLPLTSGARTSERRTGAAGEGEQSR